MLLALPVCDEIPAEKLAFVEVEDRVEVVGGNILFNCSVLCENQGLSLPQVVTGGQGGGAPPEIPPSGMDSIPPSFYVPGQMFLNGNV